MPRQPDPGPERAEARAAQVRQRCTRRAQEACDEVDREDRAVARVVSQAGQGLPLRGPVGSPTPTTTFVGTAFRHLTTKDWQRIAYWRAGIDGAGWRPEQGLDVNDETVQKVYAYYGQMWSEHPEFQWMGMGALAGGVSYGGWQDIYVARRTVDDGRRIERLAMLAGLPQLPGPVEDMVGGLPSPVGQLGKLTSEELEWYEDRFLRMQKNIFDDLAWQHEAFAMGGIATMRELEKSGQLENRNLQAWERIASGDPDQVFEGNKALLRREQYDVLQKDYDAMREHHGPVGEVTTAVMTGMAQSPVPGGKPYRELFNHEIKIPLVAPLVPQSPFGLPDPRPHVTLSVPEGNISNFDDRWAYLERDLLPRSRQLFDHPETMRQLVQTPVAQRAEQYRVLPVPYHGG